MTDTEAESMVKPKPAHMASLHGWMVKLQAAYLKVCHNLSRASEKTKQNMKQQGKAKQNTIALQKELASDLTTGTKNTNSGRGRNNRGCFGDVDKATNCLTGST